MESEKYNLDNMQGKDCIENDEIVEWLNVFGLLGMYPKVSKCKHYESEKYEKAQRGQWNCMFYEDGGSGYDPENEEKDFNISKDGDIICPDKMKKTSCKTKK